jgi:hypothetical protein
MPDPKTPDEQESINHAYAQVFGGGKYGETVMEDLGRFCWKLQSTMVQGDSDPHGRKHAFREGERNVLIYILARIEAAGDIKDLPEDAQED